MSKRSGMMSLTVTKFFPIKELSRVLVAALHRHLHDHYGKDDVDPEDDSSDDSDQVKSTPVEVQVLLSAKTVKYSSHEFVRDLLGLADTDDLYAYLVGANGPGDYDDYAIFPPDKAIPLTKLRALVKRHPTLVRLYEVEVKKQALLEEEKRAYDTREAARKHLVRLTEIVEFLESLGISLNLPKGKTLKQLVAAKAES